MSYTENPKTKGSGIVCCIPQRGACPMQCAECFFQGGRGYLEPLCEKTPNMPDPDFTDGRVVRVNDGNDSNHQRDLVIRETDRYKHRFFNTAIPRLDFPGPVVLTLNPGSMTDRDFHRIEQCPPNLMAVRMRVNTWNTGITEDAVAWYTSRGVPVILTFMAYYASAAIPMGHMRWYSWRERTSNSYWVITREGWRHIADRFELEPLVYTCGKDCDTHACARCGNCLREYFATRERMATL